MAVEDCPRCHGGKYVDGKGFIKPANQKPTMRTENVMGSTRTIYYRCSNCGYKMTRKYREDGTLLPEKSCEDCTNIGARCPDNPNCVDFDHRRFQQQTVFEGGS